VNESTTSSNDDDFEGALSSVGSSSPRGSQTGWSLDSGSIEARLNALDAAAAVRGRGGRAPAMGPLRALLAREGAASSTSTSVLSSSTAASHHRDTSAARESSARSSSSFSADQSIESELLLNWPSPSGKKALSRSLARVSPPAIHDDDEGRDDIGGWRAHPPKRAGPAARAHHHQRQPARQKAPPQHQQQQRPVSPSLYPTRHPSMTQVEGPAVMGGPTQPSGRSRHRVSSPHLYEFLSTPLFNGPAGMVDPTELGYEIERVASNAKVLRLSEGPPPVLTEVADPSKVEFFVRRSEADAGPRPRRSARDELNSHPLPTLHPAEQIARLRDCLSDLTVDEFSNLPISYGAELLALAQAVVGAFKRNSSM
jgi:hypothetical protein